MKAIPQYQFKPEVGEALDLVAGLVADKVLADEAHRQQNIRSQRIRLTEAGIQRLRQLREARA